ncbi:MAG TPA: GNAT family N-acetyltransferase [Mycobacterium sp.]|jgi:phosphinothricin acetyltransferase
MPAIPTRVRNATHQDAAACLAIYRPYVENSTVSWELDVPPVSEMAARIAAACDTHAWLVLEHDDEIVGFAYGHALNLHPAYQWTVQTGIYIGGDHHRRGGGRDLYTQLLDRLGERGYRRVLAGITQPNEASNGFHRSMGFQDVGLYRRVEWKLNDWHDVAWMQRDLPGAGSDDPASSII